MSPSATNQNTQPGWTVTISRQMGSLGMEVAQATADLLGYHPIRQELILPHLDEIAAARRYLARYQQVLIEGYDPVWALCTSVLLEF